MTLKYQATLDDLAEPHIRLHLRGKSYPAQRLKESLWSSLSGGGAAYLVMRVFYDVSHTWEISLAIAAAIGFVAYSSHKDTVSKRIRKDIRLEYAGKAPFETLYKVENSKLICHLLGTEFAFNLNHLSEIENDGERLALLFDQGVICTIPLRAFDDDAHRENFLNCVKIR